MVISSHLVYSVFDVFNYYLSNTNKEVIYNFINKYNTSFISDCIVSQYYKYVVIIYSLNIDCFGGQYGYLLTHKNTYWLRQSVTCIIMYVVDLCIMYNKTVMYKYRNTL